MRLRKECEHGRYDAHLLLSGGESTTRGIQMYLLNGGDSSEITVCPGGEFLPEGALVIESWVDVITLVGFQRDTLANLVRDSLARFKLAMGDLEPSEGEAAFMFEMEDLAEKLGVEPDALASQVGESE